MEVRQIEAKDTYSVRNIMLRPGNLQDDCMFDGDNEEITFHLAGLIDERIVSVASFYFHSNDKIEEEFQFQLRGMATLAEFQGQGMSSALLSAAFPLIKQNHVKKLWCNARVGAVGFYEKVGFTKVNGEEFDIPGVGLHFLMVKTID